MAQPADDMRRPHCHEDLLVLAGWSAIDVVVLLRPARLGSLACDFVTSGELGLKVSELTQPNINKIIKNSR